MCTNKLIFILLFSFVSLLFAKSPQQDVFTKTLPAEKGGTLDVYVNPGDIQIRTWEKNEVLLKVDGLEERELKELEFTSRNGRVKIEYDGKWGWGMSADYYITVPESYNVELYSTGGDIEVIDDINGSLDVQTMGGDIDIKNVAGDVSIQTMGGDITLLNVSGNSYISTQGGDIETGILSGPVKEVKTMGGDIDIKEVNEVKKITTYGGSIFVGSASSNLEVTTFGGNIEITKAEAGVKANTYGGSIFVGSANGLVDVSSGGGNIALKNIEGAVRARTGAGNISVELKSDSDLDSDLRTAAGDIELIVLPGSKMTINAEVNSQRKGRPNSIKSDFEGEIREIRGDTNGKFIVNGGAAEVNLRVNNGTITIIKK